MNMDKIKKIHELWNIIEQLICSNERLAFDEGYRQGLAGFNKLRYMTIDNSFIPVPTGESEKISEAELSVRTQGRLLDIGITELNQLCSLTSRELLRIKGFGRKSLNEVREYLATKNLKLRVNILGGEYGDKKLEQNQENH
jgi:DNA-directed RNA polymerase alpha subunit